MPGILNYQYTRIRSLITKSAIPGAPACDNLDGTIASEFRSLWIQDHATRRDFIYPDPDTAPAAETTTPNTDITFKMPGNTPDFSIPWLLHKNSVGVGGLIFISIDPGTATLPMFKLRIETFLTSYTTFTTGGYYISGVSPVPRSLWSRDLSASHNLGKIQIFADLRETTLPADRKVLITPIGRFNEVNQGTDVGSLKRMRIWGMHLSDFPDIG